MRTLTPAILVLLLAAPALSSTARADEPAYDPDYTVVPEPIRDDLKPLGFGLGAGSLGFTFLGVGVHLGHSVALLDAAATIVIPGPEVVLARTGRIHGVLAGMSAARAVPITASFVGLAGSGDHLGMLRSVGAPYVVLGIYDLLMAGVSGTNAIRLWADREEAPIGYTSVANTAADRAIEAGGAFAAGMLAVGTIELIVGGLATHGSLVMEAHRARGGTVSVLLVPTVGGATLAGRF